MTTSPSRTHRYFANAMVMAAGQIPGASDAAKFTAAGTAGVDTVAVTASLSLGGVCANLDTVIEATRFGALGNKVKFAAVADGTAADPTFTIAKVGDFYILTMHFLPGVTSVAAVEAAIAALPATTALGSQSKRLIVVKTAGSAAALLASPGDELSATALAGGADPIGKGHPGDGYLDEVIFHVTVSAWGALAGLQLIPMRSNSDDANTAAWSLCEPPAVITGAAHLSVSSGKLILGNTLPVNTPLAVRVPCAGARRVRLGVRNSAGVADGAAAASVDLEMVVDRVSP